MPVAGWVKTGVGRTSVGAGLAVVFMLMGGTAAATGFLIEQIFAPYLYGYSSDIGGLETLAIVTSTVTLTFLVLLLLLARTTRPRWVSVGSDGVRLANGNIVRHTAIARVDPDPTGVRITKKDGSFVTVAFEQGADTAAAWVERQFALLSRIEWFQENAARTNEASRLRVLDRDGRTEEEHHRALRAVAQRSGGYRRESVTAEDLERVMDDAESPAERRVAAAVALSGFDRARAAEKIRVVIPTCVDEKLRVALEAVAKEDELAELDAEAEELRRRAR
jgi:hypothetical protein